MGKASECGKHVSECDTLCLMKFGGHENQTFSSFYSAAVQNATNTTRRDNTTSNTTHSSPIDAHFADMENSQKSNTIQSIAVDRPLQSRDGNEDTPTTEDDEMPEDEPVDSNCMSKCRLHNMPICISEFDGCYFSCKDEFVKPSMSRLSDAKKRSPANNRTKEGKEGDTEGLAAEMGRLNDFEKVRKNVKERVRKGIDDLKATDEKYNQDGERLKQQGEELKKKAEAETIKREAERHAANLKKELDEVWKTGKEEIEHAHEEVKEVISAAEAIAKDLKEKAKEAKKRMVARFSNLKKEEESVLSAAKDKLAALRMKMQAAQLAHSPEQEKKEKEAWKQRDAKKEVVQMKVTDQREKCLKVEHKRLLQRRTDEDRREQDEQNAQVLECKRKQLLIKQNTERTRIKRLEEKKEQLRREKSEFESREDYERVVRLVVLIGTKDELIETK
ncbi:hypothetical protein BLNAU_17740 [Blattamonas nauphoetae]|uniref:Uncharacterized protein n=1 Tax=Blattamonas nauphoetae TaxID=2049346 RepID=A0ABQ9X6Y2_9EUKA|nr:hypothetical protein BLNAU_17740 [Blattamonas nauphoetae]